MFLMLKVLFLLVFVALLGVSLYFNYRHARIIIDTEDALSEALDIMDTGYRALSDVLETPILHDSPEVRNAVFQIKRVRDSIQHVAIIMAEPYGGVVDVEEDLENGSTKYN